MTLTYGRFSSHCILNFPSHNCCPAQRSCNYFRLAIRIILINLLIFRDRLPYWEDNGPRTELLWSSGTNVEQWRTLGGASDQGVLEGSGGMLPRKIFKILISEIAFAAF